MSEAGAVLAEILPGLREAEIALRPTMPVPAARGGCTATWSPVRR